MDFKERKKMFKDIFAPRSGEKVLLLMDVPHGSIKDSEAWKERREMVNEWYQTFKEMGEESGFTVDTLKFKATGKHNSILPTEVIDRIRENNLVIVMTEYSASSSLIPIISANQTITRIASMPMVEKRMEETSLKADYSKVRKYAVAIEKLLNDAIGAEILFSTGDRLYIDLRNRTARSDKGECRKAGQGINLPSGEGCKVPYEAAHDEISEFGESKTEGTLPVRYNVELVKYIVRNNKIVEIIGNGENAEKMRIFFGENDTRRNIAELGIGCNPHAVVTGNVLEDEKVGLHIAYGMSVHLGGKIKSDLHMDICYSKGCPIEGTTVKLINMDGTKTELIQDGMLLYELLE